MGQQLTFNYIALGEPRLFHRIESRVDGKGRVILPIVFREFLEQRLWYNLLINRVEHNPEAGRYDVLFKGEIIATILLKNRIAEIDPSIGLTIDDIDVSSLASLADFYLVEGGVEPYIAIYSPLDFERRLRGRDINKLRGGESERYLGRHNYYPDPTHGFGLVQIVRDTSFALSKRDRIYFTGRGNFFIISKSQDPDLLPDIDFSV